MSSSAHAVYNHLINMCLIITEHCYHSKHANEAHNFNLLQARNHLMLPTPQFLFGFAEMSSAPKGM